MFFQPNKNSGINFLKRDHNVPENRPSGTEPLLRIYAEGRTADMVTALLAYGEKVATDATQ